MSTDPREDEDDDVLPEPLPVNRDDGATELDQRAVFQVLFRDPAVRNFTFAALGALGMIFLILLQQASDLGGLLIVVIGVCGVLLRWTAAPVFVLLLLLYFQIFPTGIPADAYENNWEIVERRFHVTDIMLVLSVLVYLACQYRIYGLIAQAIAFEGSTRRKDEVPTRRPPALIRPAEFGVMLGVCAVFVVLGQLVWWFANSVEVMPAESFPLRWAEDDWAVFNPVRSVSPGQMGPGLTRFVILAGVLFFGTLLARLVFGYWRLRMMNQAEGGMILLDGGWSDTHRERQRVETWRVWGRKQAEIQAKEAEQAAKAKNKRS